MSLCHKVAFIAIAVCMALIPALDAEAKSKHRGRNAAIGVLGAAAALAIISSSARADDRPRRARGAYDEDGHAYRCHRWSDRCDDGERWACRKFVNNC